MSSSGGGVIITGHEPVILGRGDRTVTITLEDLHTIVAALPDGILKDVINHLLNEVPTPQVDGGQEPDTTPPSE